MKARELSTITSSMVSIERRVCKDEKELWLCFCCLSHPQETDLNSQCEGRDTGAGCVLGAEQPALLDVAEAWQGMKG